MQRIIVVPDSHIRTKVDLDVELKNIKVIKVHESKQAAIKVIGVPDDDLLLATIAIRIAHHFNTVLLVFDNRISDIAFTILRRDNTQTSKRICLMNVKMPLHYTFRVSLSSLVKYVRFGKYVKVLYVHNGASIKERTYEKLMYRLERVDEDCEHPGYRIAIFSKDISPDKGVKDA